MSRHCDAIIRINHEDYINAKKMCCKQIYVIPSVGLDNRYFTNVHIERNQYRESLGIKPDDIMVLSVGELSSRKNQQIIIKATASLTDRGKYVFVICGTAAVNSTSEYDLCRLAKDLGVRISLLGHRFDIPEINCCADIAVIPSVRERFGMTGVEALASGIPVVGSNVEGIREYVVPGKTGYLCNPYSEQEFASAIEKVTKTTLKERQNIAVNCRKKAEDFDVSKSIVAMKKNILGSAKL